MSEEHNTTGNVGEWSELYALANILASGGVNGADENQNKKADLFYTVLKVILEEKIGKRMLTYTIKDDVVEIFSDDKKIAILKAKEISTALQSMFSDLSVRQAGRAFPLSSGAKMMAILHRHTIKASSRDKKDLAMVILDGKTKIPTPEVGFSIKSQLGSPSTLINASMATNFTYEILDQSGNVPKTLPTLHPKNVKDNICLLKQKGYEIKFDKIDNETFKKNVSFIDSNLEKHLARLLLSYYSREGSALTDLLQISFPSTDKNNEQPLLKIKEFLSIMAFGMMPDTAWNGILTSLGGILLVKKNGDVLCYYVYNLEEFQNYLIRNTKLETPSTTRYGIGRIIKEKGHYYIKLNLQVRFTK